MRIPAFNNVLNTLPRYRGRKVTLVRNQGVTDVIGGMVNTHNNYAAQYDAIAPQFADKNPKEVGRKLWYFLKNNTYYVIEPDSQQTLRSPSAILALGANPAVGLDCKSYSLFCGGVLAALNRQGYNIPWAYRYASYRFFDPLPHHVFVVLFPGTDREIWVDPVLAAFNQKKPYFYKKDKNMALVGISGPRRQNRLERREAKRPGSIARKRQRREKIKKAIRQGGKIAVRINPATITARNAFLLIVKLNVFNIARRLAVLMTRQPEKLEKFWKQIGGNYSNLVKNIRQGAKIKAPAMPLPRPNAMGEVATATAAAVASATPIIIKIIRLLKEAGIGADDLANVAGRIIKGVVKNKIAQDPATGAEAGVNQAVENIEEGGPDEEPSEEAFDEVSDNEEIATEDNTGQEESGTAMDGIGAIELKNLLPIAAIGAGIYFLTKK